MLPRICLIEIIALAFSDIVSAICLTMFWGAHCCLCSKLCAENHLHCQKCDMHLSSLGMAWPWKVSMEIEPTFMSSHWNMSHEYEIFHMFFLKVQIMVFFWDKKHSGTNMPLVSCLNINQVFRDLLWICSHFWSAGTSWYIKFIHLSSSYQALFTCNRHMGVYLNKDPLTTWSSKGGIWPATYRLSSLSLLAQKQVMFLNWLSSISAFSLNLSKPPRPLFL